MSKRSGKTNSGVTPVFELAYKNKRIRDFKMAYAASSNVHLLDYENAETFARTILDAASETEWANDLVRPHIFAVLRRNGSISVSYKHEYAICFISMTSSSRQDSARTEGTVKIFDPNQQIFKVVSEEIDYCRSLYDEYTNSKGNSKI